MGGFEVVEPGYRVLYERAVEVLGADPRVTAIQVGGSIGAGSADAWSDLDLHVVASTDGFDSLVAEWPTWLAAITPTVFARTPIMPFIVNSLTPDGLTLDIAVFKSEVPGWLGSPTQYTVGMVATQRFDNLGDALAYAVAEMLRGTAGPFITLVQRGDHLRHMTGVPHILGLLATVFLAETGALPPGKVWTESFTEEQLAAVAALPPVRATRDGVVGFGLGVAELVMTRARPLFPRYELEWPAHLARVSAARLRDCLDIDASVWLY